MPKSNKSQLSIGIQSALGADPTLWTKRLPTAFAQNFGETVKSEAPLTINAERSEEEPSPVDFDAVAGWTEILTSRRYHHAPELQSVFFAAARQKATTLPLNGSPVTITAVDGTNDQFEAASGLDVFKVGSIVEAGPASAFANAENAGIHVLDAVAAGAVDTPDDLVAETPAAGAYLREVGHQWGASELDIVGATGGNLPRISRASGTKPLTDLALLPGSVAWLGGDLLASRFTEGVNRGWFIVNEVGAAFIEAFETEFEWVDETGTDLTIQIFTGTEYRNETAENLIVDRYLQAEQTLDRDADGIMSRVERDALGNTYKVTIPVTKLITQDIGLVALSEEQRTGAQGLKTGTRPAIETGKPYNASSHVVYKRLALVTAGEAAPSPLVTHLENIALEISNGVKANKEIGTAGGFDFSTGNFKVSVQLDAYFDDVEANARVRDGSRVSLSVGLSQDNHGWFYYLPAGKLSSIQINVVRDEPIKTRITNPAYRSPFGPTFITTEFPYLPDIAALKPAALLALDA